MDGARDYYSGLANEITKVIEQKHTYERLETQSLRWHDTCELISGSGNHEAQMVVGMILAAEPERYFSSGTLDRAITERQGSDPGWIPARRGAFMYCQQSLEPIGQVVHGTIMGGRRGLNLVSAYKINSSGLEMGQPAWGLLSDWSLRYPDLSVQHVFGKTSSIGSHRAAETRLNILTELLTSPNPTGIAVSEIEGLGQYSDQAHYHGLEEFERLGFVKIERAEKHNDRQFRLIDPEYRGKIPFDKLKSEACLVYEYLETLAPGTIFSYEQVMDYVLKRTAESNPQVDQSSIRDFLTGRLGNAKQFPGIERINIYGTDANTRTRATLFPEYIEPFNELMQIVMAVNDKDTELLSHGRRLAKEIINNPSKVATLMTKARNFSSMARSKGSAHTASAIKSIVLESDEPLSIEDVHQIIHERGYKIGRITVAKYLLNLSEEAKVQKVLIQKGRSRHEITHYTRVAE